MDHIIIRDLLARCIIGLGDEERRDKQDVVINIVLTTDLRLPGRSDRIEDAIDYSTLKKRMVSMIENSAYHLVEALAESLARICLEDPRVVEARITVEKPSALRFARSVGVEIVRERAED
jgi:FolB domain-containing protein